MLLSEDFFHTNMNVQLSSRCTFCENEKIVKSKGQC